MNREHNPMDSAALSAGAVAAVISVTGPKGPFDINSAVTGLVIVFVLIAYEYPVKRDWRQNVAFAAVLGLSSLTISGYVLEVMFTPYKDKSTPFENFLYPPGKVGTDTIKIHLPGNAVALVEEKDTWIPKGCEPLSWLLMSIVFWFIARAGSDKAVKNFTRIEIVKKEKDAT